MGHPCGIDDSVCLIRSQIKLAFQTHYVGDLRLVAIHVVSDFMNVYIYASG